jgi:aldehyde dehydrogenase (NAD+)
MKHYDKIYINGQWVPARGEKVIPVINPANETAFADVKSASSEDVEAAVAAAKAAFPAFSQTSITERIALLEKLLAAYERRRGDFSAALTEEMGAPKTLSETGQTGLGVAHIQATIDALKNMAQDIQRGTTSIEYEAAGVAALITPWNWPINQVFTKAASAIAAGCTMVLKPSQVSPIDAILFTELIDEVGFPKGVFNLVTGDGVVIGRQLSLHPDVDVVSFTGSTRAGREISRDAAETIKVVHLELGGKSPNVILDDADFEAAVSNGVHACFSNAGQSCSVATRMIVPRSKLAEVNEIAKRVAETYVVGDPTKEETTMGPLVNERQFKIVQGYIEKGIAEGATLLTGGPGRPAGLDKGYFTKPTVFTDVDPKSTIAQEEIFGPVLSIIAYDTVDEAIEIANDSIYGLAGVVQSRDREKALKVARKIRAGHVYINHLFGEYANVPFGGWKQSGTGYEHADFGIRGFQLVKSILGANA